MQPAPKPAETAPEIAAPAADHRPASPEIVAEGVNPWKSAHLSPARALQARLWRELNAEAPSWQGHAVGLVLVTALSVWIAAILLNAGI
jgi:hypothetical protein